MVRLSGEYSVELPAWLYLFKVGFVKRVFAWVKHIQPVENLNVLRRTRTRNETMSTKIHGLDEPDALGTSRYLCQCLDNEVKMGYGGHVLEYHMPRRLTSWPDAGRGWPLWLVRALASQLLSPEAGVLHPHIFIQESWKSCTRSIDKEKEKKQEAQLSVFWDVI